MAIIKLNVCGTLIGFSDIRLFASLYVYDTAHFYALNSHAVVANR